MGDLAEGQLDKPLGLAHPLRLVYHHQTRGRGHPTLRTGQRPIDYHLANKLLDSGQRAVPYEMGCCNKLSLTLSDKLLLGLQSQLQLLERRGTTRQGRRRNFSALFALVYCQIHCKHLKLTSRCHLPALSTTRLSAAACHFPLATCRLSASRDGKCWARHSTGGHQQQLLARLAPFSIISQGWARDKANGIVCHKKSLKRTELKAQIVGQQLWKYFKLKVKSTRIH